MKIHVSERWEPFIRSQMQSGKYASEDDVVDEALDLLRQREAEQARERSRVESLLIQGLDSGPATPMTPDDWDEVEREGQRLIAERKAKRPR
ncbi:type II toxin-antitoxin system ParD family antitoxin [Tautonia sp. JC769]|uniref:type II toxin-antitoxin system ParD family antitoxin n=1 Tax=Tautonia sp. JC769 TaxID=3232135 RepID=UPI0034588475